GSNAMVAVVRARASFEPPIVVRGHTGRKFAADADYYAVEAWAKRPCWILPYTIAAWRFRRQLGAVTLVDDEYLECYRGRVDDGTVLGWEQMGPPPASVKDDRYNRRRRPAFYLCESKA